MSVFKLPAWVIRDLDKIRKRFIWNSNGDSKKGVHLVAWQRMCLPKEAGGVGLHDLKVQNTAMLLRWWWILHCNKDSQWSVIAKTLLHKRTCTVPPLLWNQKGSFFWRDLQAMRFLFQMSTLRKIGNGANISFWFDNWAGQPLRFLHGQQDNPPKPLISLHQGLREVEVLLPNPRTLHDTQVIQCAPQNVEGSTQDGTTWRWARDGCFSVKSMYRALIMAGKTVSPIKHVWKIKVPPSVCMFMYLMASERLLTQQQLSRRGIHVEPGCVMCGAQSIETVEHLFFTCPFATTFWMAVGVATGCQPPEFSYSVRSSIEDMLLKQRVPEKHSVFVATAFWLVWLERNNRTFRQQGKRIEELVESVLTLGEAFFRTC